MGENEAYKFAVNESDYTDIYKSPMKSILNYSEARNYMSIQVNDPNATNAVINPTVIGNPPVKKKKGSSYGCGPKNSKCNIF